MKWLHRILLASVLVFFGSHVEGSSNILLIIADDMGVETLSSYGIGSPVAVTPVLDQLAAQGMRFKNFWAAPTCTPTRAHIASGRYGFRTGVTGPIFSHAHLLDTTENPIPPPVGSHKELMFSVAGPKPHLGSVGVPKSMLARGLPKGLGLDEVALPQAIKNANDIYATGGFGKWHLNSQNNGGLSHPNAAGFDLFSGSPFGSPDSFFSWFHNINGNISVEKGYIDQRIVDDTLSWISRQKTPWFAWVGLANPHVPEHLPPLELLHSGAKALNPNDLSVNNTQPYFLARIEAMDTLIGQLLQGLSEKDRSDTYVIFLGDNGTLKWSGPPSPVPWNRAKGTVYQGGVHVPFIVSGPRVPPGSIEMALGSAVDLYATIIELVGGDVRSAVGDERIVDSRSLARIIRKEPGTHPREYIYTESLFGPAPAWAIRDAQYKLVRIKRRKMIGEEFYDLYSDPYEQNDLVGKLSADQGEAYRKLAGELDVLLN